MKLDLPNDICSPQDLSDLTVEMREYAKWLKHETIKQKTGVKASNDSPALSPSGTKILNGIDIAKIDDLIEALEDYAKNAPSITITLAAIPTVAVKEKLTKWCRNNLADNILVNFRYSSAILGGMVVRYGSRIFDWSFRRQLLTTKNNFAEVMSRV